MSTLFRVYVEREVSSVPLSCRGLVIETIDIEDHTLTMRLGSEYRSSRDLVIRDIPECCENRYFHSDDDLDAFIGARFYGFKVSKCPYPGKGEFHEIAFLTIRTSLGDMTIETHNVHNGYYSGFELDISVREVE